MSIANYSSISIVADQLQVPDKPIIPFIEGDGSGPDIWRATERVLDAAVKAAYGKQRQIHWLEIYAGEKAKTSLITGCLTKPLPLVKNTK